MRQGARASHNGAISASVVPSRVRPRKLRPYRSTSRGLERLATPRPLWSGAVSLGLVTVPIKLEAAADRHDASLHLVHTEDGGRIRYHKAGTRRPGLHRGRDQQELRGQQGHRHPDLGAGPSGHAALTAKAIEIVAFIPADQVDPVQYGAGSPTDTPVGVSVTSPQNLDQNQLADKAREQWATRLMWPRSPDPSPHQRVADVRCDQRLVLPARRWPHGPTTVCAPRAAQNSDFPEPDVGRAP